MSMAPLSSIGYTKVFDVGLLDILESADRNESRESEQLRATGQRWVPCRGLFHGTGLNEGENRN